MLTEHHTEIFNTRTNNRKFSLRYAGFNQIYKKSLLSEATDIDPFVIDKMLLEEAREIETKIKSYVQL